tara:strand:+ start:27304 stop:29742 length:2439 start_codon:yes stop_codon:yes gene_type:complete
MVKGKHDNYYIFLIFVFTIVFFIEPIFLKVTFYFRDIFHSYYPSKLFFVDEIKSGRFPLWNPYLYKGTPFYADPSMSVFYPLNILFLFLPFHAAFKYLIILHYFLFGLFGYIFFRSIKISSYSSLFASIALMFSGYMVFLHSQLNFLQSAVWLPLILYFFIKALSNNAEFKWIGFISIALSVQFFGGNPQDVFISLIFMTTIGAWKITSNKNISLRTFLKIMLAAGLISLGLSSLQLLPALELAGLSSRGSGVSFDEAVQWSFNPIRIIEFLFPFPFGKIIPEYTYYGQFLTNNSLNLPWTLNVYMGVIPVFFAFISILRKKYSYPFIILTILFIFLSFGKYTPLYYLFFKFMPVFNMFRYPEKFMMAATFSSAVLCAVGCDSFLRYTGIINYQASKGTEKKVLIKVKRIYERNVKFVIYFVSLVTVTFVVFSIFDRILIELYNYLVKSAGISVSALAASNVLKESLSHFVLFSLLFIFLFFGRKKGILSMKLFQFLLIVSLFADITLTNKNLVYYAPHSFYTFTPQIAKDIDKLSNENELFRIYRTHMGYNNSKNDLKNNLLDTYEKQRLWEKNSLKKNIGNMYHISYLDGYETLELKDYTAFFQELKQYPYKMFNLLNVKYIITTINDKRFSDKDKYGLLSIDKKNNLKLIKNKGYFNRSFLVSNALYFKSKKNHLKTISREEFNFKNTVALESNIKYRMEDTLTQNADCCEFVDYKPTYMRADINAEQDSFFVLSDSYYPGWKGYVDGLEVPVLRANYVLRALFVKAGNHRVEFKFKPAYLKAGIILSSLTLILLIIFYIKKAIYTIRL